MTSANPRLLAGKFVYSACVKKRTTDKYPEFSDKRSDRTGKPAEGSEDGGGNVNF